MEKEERVETEEKEEREGEGGEGGGEGGEGGEGGQADEIFFMGRCACTHARRLKGWGGGHCPTEVALWLISDNISFFYFVSRTSRS